MPASVSPHSVGVPEIARLAAIIIEPSRGTRRLDPKDSQPHSLDLDETHNRPAIEWLLHALDGIEISDILYVGGYHIEKIAARYPGLRFAYQKDRARQGELASMLLAFREARELIVARADVLYLGEFFQRLVAERGAAFGEIVSSKGERMTVAMRIPVGRFDELSAGAKALVRANPMANFNDLRRHLDGTEALCIDLDGLAAPITDRSAVLRTVFKGKAQTLDNIAPLSQEASVLPRHRFTVAEWAENSGAVIAAIQAKFPAGRVIVRSSSVSEDRSDGSAAGAFLSVPDIDVTDDAHLAAAVRSVIESFGKNRRAISSRDEVLIQPQVDDLISCGVLLTKNPRSGAPYFILNTDETTGRSDLVTSGGEGKIKTYCALPGYPRSHLPEPAQRTFVLGDELVELSHVDRLDIEFGIVRQGTCYLFQVRPLFAGETLPVSEADFFDMIDGAKTFVRAALGRRNGLIGQSSVLGSMPDWNPVEMLGGAPRPLALSIYQELIGDISWAEARARIGYRKVTPEALILSVAGKPYVDVRASLNSLLPADLPDGIAERWIDAGIERLGRNPHLHDKLEFEIAATCLAPDWPSHARRMAAAGLSEDEIATFKESLRRLTQSIVDRKVEPISGLGRMLDELDSRRHAILAADVHSVSDIARRIRHLMVDCRQHGIVPFSILARYAFIAMALLRGLRDSGAIDEVEFDRFLISIPTVASRLSDDLWAYAEGRLRRDELVARYGHLRPHSYDIASQNYASDPERYFNIRGLAARRQAEIAAKEESRAVLRPKARKIEAAFEALGMKIPFDVFVDFVADAITGRESAKFQFMKNLNDVLEEIARLGGLLDFSRDQLAFIPIGDITRLGTDSYTTAQRGYYRRMIEFLEKKWLLTGAIRLPDLIRTPDEIGAFEVMHEQPNFVTGKRVTGRVVWLDDAPPPYDLDGAIVAIRSADPGFDWIFGHAIVGLLTQYGGIASHMSIRAAEFGLPAAIGCGAAIFDHLHGAAEIEIDSPGRLVKRL